MIIQEILLSGLALNYTFHGLSAGTEYTISVTAATDAGLGTQTTITATTVASPVQSLETSISAPGMVHACTLLQTDSLLYHALLFGIFNTVAGSMVGILVVVIIVLAGALCIW